MRFSGTLQMRLDVGGPKVIQLPLPPGLEAFVQDLVNTGRYSSVEEVVHHALWLLKDQTDFRAMKLAELRKQIAVGIEQADRGEVAPLDMNAILAEAMQLLQQEREKQQEVVACPR
jgi:antitoxin ParD1/3/4